MQPTLCSKCKKNVAVVFITKIENGKAHNEGLCLKCARELGLKPVDDIIQKMGLNEDDLDNLTQEMTGMLSSADELNNVDEDNDNVGETATFPFLNRLFSAQKPEREEKGASDTQRRQSSKPKDRKYLNAYCSCLTEKAKNGELDALIGRDTELERVVQILNRRQKNNPCLIGEPGVGKTAIAEGLAQRIVSGNVPYKLRDKQIYQLDMTSMVAGTQYRGQFEGRMKGLLDEVRKLGNIILYIDEVHSIAGAGDSEGSMNAANILKPALSRGEIQVIGATTFTEYRKYIEKDSALERRFQPVTVSEPTVEESVRILCGVAHYYESFHSVTVSPEIARQCVILSERYITDRYLPDKAIDLLDEACSDLNLRSPMIRRLEELRKDLADIDLTCSVLQEKDETDAADYEQLARLRSERCRLEDEQTQLLQNGLPPVTLENLARIIELWTKIPASKIQEQEYDQLRHLEERLKQHIMGQDEAISAVAGAIRRRRVGVSTRRRPVSFIFTGPTGVGKTELVKVLSNELFNDTEALVRLDMSEYMEKHSVSKIIGSPPGYVGYDEAGQLTETVRRRPYCVILFDELEKAHADVTNILLQILDDGRITDAHGRVVNFENTIIIMTSNAGSEQSTGALGFGRSVGQQGREKALKSLREFLRPEFLNRVDEVICFNHLSEENFRDIGITMLGALRDSLAERGLQLTWTDSVLDYLVRASFSVTYGARNLRRTIQKDIEDRIVQQILDSYLSPVSTISVDSQDGQIQVRAQ